MKKNTRKSILRSTGIFLLTLAVAALPSLSLAQGPSAAALQRFYTGEGVLVGLSAISTQPQILIQYTGSAALGGTVTVAAGGDITFGQGAVGASVADATMECDASIAATGSRNGIYDLSTPHANCDTLGEVVDLINSQGTNWLAVIVHGLRSDPTDNVFITLSEAAANSVDGLGLLSDGTTLFKASRALIPAAALKMPFYKVGLGRTARALKANPFEGLTPILYNAVATSTYGSGTSAHEVHCVAVKNSLTVGSETVTTYTSAAGATTVANTFAPNTSFGVACPKGQKMLYRTANSAAMTASTLYLAGHIF